MTLTTSSSKAQLPPGVICGTDFSPAAAQAVNVAAALARRLKTPLELVHATALPADPAPREKLDAEADRVRKPGIEVSPALLSGHADEELVKRAVPGSCQLVVVASLGQRGAPRWLLGSVSERTAQRAAVPTLVVRNAAPIEAWARKEQPLKIFVAFNFTATSEAALTWVRGLQAIGPCDIVVGFVDWLPDQRARLGGSDPLPLVNNPPEIQAVLERDLKARATELLGTAAFRTRIEANWGRADERLVDMAREENADLLVVGSHQYSGFERMWHASTSRGILHAAAMNVAVVPLSAVESPGVGIARPVQRVLVATDFSALANCAIPHAYSLVRRGGMVHLVHVVHPEELPGGAYQQGPLTREFETEHARHAGSCTDRLRALIPPEARALGISSEIEVAVHRNPAEGILQAAERIGANVICLGTHGGSGVINALLGSVAQTVMAQSTRPLLVVRPPRP